MTTSGDAASRPFPSARPVAEPVKWCNGCGQVLPQREFYPYTRSNGGRNPHCKHCHKALSKKWHKVNQSRRSVRPPKDEETRRLSRIRDSKRYRDDVKRRAGHLLRTARFRASARDMVCNLSVAWIEAGLRRGACAVTRLPFCFDGSSRCFAPSIDRIDPRVGYEEDNCRIVVFAYNAAKGAGTDQDVLVLAKAIVEAMGGKDLGAK